MAEETEMAIHASVVADVVGDNTLVGAAPGRRIKVLAFHASHSVAGTGQFFSGPGGTPLGGAFRVGLDAHVTLPYSPEGWFVTNVGQALVYATPGLVNLTRGVLVYELTG